MKRMILLAVSFAAALALIAACTQAAPTPTEAPPIIEETTEEPALETETEPDVTEEVDEAEELIVERCSVCHSVDRVFSADKTEEQWDTTIDRMIDLGAEVSDEEKELMIDWLTSPDN